MHDHPLPLFERLLIESQATCNRDCWFCPRTFDRSGSYRDAEGRNLHARMPTEKILELMDQAVGLGFGGWTAFHHFSEPLLDKRNLDLAREARERGLRPYLITNGDALRADQALCLRVCAVYEKVVVGLYDYEDLAELEEAKKFWKERLPGVELKFSPISPLGVDAGFSTGVPKALVPSDSRMATPDLTFGNAPCARPLIRLIVRHDGAVCLCCEDVSGDFSLGNVYERSLREIWHSERHVEIVRDLLSGRREKYALCSNCPMPPSGSAGSGAPEITIAFRNNRRAP